MRVEDRDFEDPAEDRQYTPAQRFHQYRHRKNGGCPFELTAVLSVLVLLWRLLR